MLRVPSKLYTGLYSADAHRSYDCSMSCITQCYYQVLCMWTPHHVYLNVDLKVFHSHNVFVAPSMALLVTCLQLSACSDGLFTMLQGLANFHSSGSCTCGTRSGAQALLFPVLVLSLCTSVVVCARLRISDATADRHTVSKYVALSKAKVPWQL